MKIVVSSFVYRKSSEGYEFLLLKRVKDKGGFWQPPSGLQEENETVLDCAYRELWEESSINKDEVVRVIEPFYDFTMDKHYLTGEPIPTIKSYFLAFEVGPNVNIKLDNNHCNEHEEFIWVNSVETFNLLKWDNNKEALTKLLELLP